MATVESSGNLTDMSGDELRRALQSVSDRIAAFLEAPDRWRVLPDVVPGAIRAALPAAAPEQGESFDSILADFDRLIMPATTHWNHPGFMAYFASSGSAPGILAESLIAMLNINAMVWRTGPAATELEEVTLAWVRDLMGLPPQFDGVINDTASTSTLYALAAAREALAGLKIRQHGLAGRADVPRLAVYCSEEAHSAADKAAITLGLGMDAIRRLPADANFQLDPAALRAAIAADRRAGILPMAVVATVGTTSTASIDPVTEIADICEAEKIWLHVDAAYAGPAAFLPELKHIMDGCERADSLVMNPHKWMFVPIDCSLLYTRHPEIMRQTFSLTPDFLTTSESDVARNLMDYGVALGRRFRALKLWFVLRWFGARGIADRIRTHIRMAAEFAAWVDAHPEFERLAPQQFSVVVFRHLRAGMDAAALDAHNARILDAVNASGEIFLSQTRAKGRYALRVAIGNLRTADTHVQRAWQLIREAAAHP